MGRCARRDILELLDATSWNESRAKLYGMFDRFRRKKQVSVPLEKQLNVLQKGGIHLAPGFRPEHLLASFTREEFENDPYRLLLCLLGSEAEDHSEFSESLYLSDQIWHFDTECIEDHGSYRVIAERMVALTQNALPLQQIEDFVDIENGLAWLAFTLDGVAQKWIAKVEEDWVDPTILSRLAELLDSRRTGRRFTYVDLQGQDCLIGCATPEQRAWLRENTGLEIDWLT